ncbi:MAG: ribosome maturation factor RimM [Alphaproteobacteria bacterium]
MTERAKMVCLGVISGAHGVKGAVRIKTFTAEPEAIAAYGPVTDEAGAHSFRLSLAGTARGQAIARIPGVADRDAAEALKGMRLYIAREALPATKSENEFYVSDLVGLAVETRGGTALGHVLAVHDFGAGEVLEIGENSATSVMLPFTDAVVPLVDLSAGKLVVEPPPGFLDAPKAARKKGGAP